MQKISTYLYPNRVQLLVDLAAFNVEYTNVYQRIVKIYNGIDNTIEFDIKNADQKRIDLTTLSSIQLNVMDATGTELPNSPYTVTPTAMKGIATVTIPQEDLTDLTEQFLKYSVTALKDGADVMIYAD
jgi:spore germination protein GerM